MTWTNFDQGKTLETQGSEQGIILRDEEYSAGARVTLEQAGCTAPFTITSAIYGWMFHTSFFSTLQEAEAAFEEMKNELSEIFQAIPPVNDPDLDRKEEELSEKITDFVVRH